MQCKQRPQLENDCAKKSQQDYSALFVSHRLDCWFLWRASFCWCSRCRNCVTCVYAQVTKTKMERELVAVVDAREHVPQVRAAAGAGAAAAGGNVRGVEGLAQLVSAAAADTNGDGEGHGAFQAAVRVSCVCEVGRVCTRGHASAEAGAGVAQTAHGQHVACLAASSADVA